METKKLTVNNNIIIRLIKKGKKKIKDVLMQINCWILSKKVGLVNIIDKLKRLNLIQRQ